MESRSGVFDMSRLAAVCGDGSTADRELLVQLLGMFLADNGARIRDLHPAVQRGHAEGVRRLAHAIAGSAGTAGALRVAELAREIEADAVAGRLPSSQALDTITHEFSAVRTALLAMYPSIQES